MNKNMKDWLTADIDDLIDCDYSEPKVKSLYGITEKEVLECNTMPDCFITSYIEDITKKIVEEDNKLFYKECISLHIDPDVVIKQAKEIERLAELNKRMFECCCKKVCKEINNCRSWEETEND